VRTAIRFVHLPALSQAGSRSRPTRCRRAAEPGHRGDRNAPHRDV